MTRRWPARPRAAAAVRAAVLLVPLLLAVAVGVVVARVAGGYLAALVAALVVLVAADRLARRLLPLAALLRLSLVFPDQAPDRLRLALLAGSTRALTSTARDDSPAGRAAVRVLALLAQVARHDASTRRHTERVRAYVDLIAEELGLAEGDRDLLRWAALLHDVGKTAVDVRVLRKPARLDEQEWRLVREHPAAGARMAADLADFLGPWFGGIGEHHERWDGTGYPRGLAGEQISRSGRIVAVADAFEVMTATRSYQRPRDPAAAREELVACGGTQFDPEVVRALLSVSLARLRRVLGPAAAVALLPVLGPGRADPHDLLHLGSDVGLPVQPPIPLDDGLLLGAVGLHPAAALPTHAAPHAAAVPSGSDGSAVAGPGAPDDQH